MRLPDSERAIVNAEKVHDYLLSRSHSVGSEKARVFEALGYRAARWRRLQYDLYLAAQQDDAERVGETPHGQKYRIRTMLKGPNGRSMAFISIWIAPSTGGFPRFVTAYPDAS
jgi:hypothetical protein